MTTQMTREYPQLPILPMEMSLKVLRLAKLGPTTIAQLTGFSRVSASLWLAGKANNPNSTSIEAVSTLAYKALRALKYRHLPAQSPHLMPQIVGALRDQMYPIPLSDTPPEELLPKAWLKQFNLPRTQHEPEPVL